MSSSMCSGMQGIYAWLTGGSICLLYICIVLDLAVGVVVCKASMVDWGYRSSSGCSGMQGIYAQLTGGLSAFYIYMHCTRCSSGCSSIEGIYAWLTGGSTSSSWCKGYARHLCSIDWGVHLPLYICIVLDLAVDVVVCKASVLNWLGRV